MKPSRPTSTKGMRRKPSSATEQAKPDLMQQPSPQSGPPQQSKPDPKPQDETIKKAADFRRWAENEPNEIERNRLLAMATLGEQLAAMRSRTSSGEPSPTS